MPAALDAVRRCRPTRYPNLTGTRSCASGWRRFECVALWASCRQAAPAIHLSHHGLGRGAGGGVGCRAVSGVWRLRGGRRAGTGVWRYASVPRPLVWACDRPADQCCCAGGGDAGRRRATLVLDRAYDPLRPQGACGGAPPRWTPPGSCGRPTRRWGLTGVRGGYAIAPWRTRRGMPMNCRRWRRRGRWARRPWFWT